MLTFTQISVTKYKYGIFNAATKAVMEEQTA